jgi:GT2 family glycosyltransferase
MHELPAMDSGLKISIIIITYNRPADMLELAGNIASLDNPGLLDEVIILNNRSTSDYSAVEKFVKSQQHIPFRYLLADENLGVARGRNFAAQKTNAPVLVFIDDDAIFQNKDALLQIRTIFSEEANRNTGIVAFRIFYNATMNYQVNAFPHKQFEERKNWHRFDTYYFSGCAHAIRKEVFDKAGFYPGNFFYGMEEYDLSYRTLDTGFKIIYDDRITVLHKESPTGRLTNKEKLRSMWVNKTRVAWKYLPKKYFYATALLWSWQYLRKTSWNFGGWLKGWKEISRISSTEKRIPVSKATLSYLQNVKARLTY